MTIDQKRGRRGRVHQGRFCPKLVRLLKFISFPVNVRRKTPKEQIRNAILGLVRHNITIASAS